MLQNTSGNDTTNRRSLPVSDADFNVDDLEDFIETANTMPEWMKHDPSLIRVQRDALARFTVEGSLDWQICHQIANRQKHVKPQRPGGPARGRLC
jgi:hypothetical protein